MTYLRITSRGALSTAFLAATLLFAGAAFAEDVEPEPPPPEPCRMESSQFLRDEVLKACNDLIPGGVKSAPDPQDRAKIAAGQNLIAQLKARASLFADKADYDSALSDMIRMRKLEKDEFKNNYILDFAIYYAANSDFESFYQEFERSAEFRREIEDKLKTIEKDLGKKSNREERAAYYTLRAMAYASSGNAAASQAELARSVPHIDPSDIKNEAAGIFYVIRIALLERYRMDPQRVLRELDWLVTAPVWDSQIGRHVRPGLLTALGRRYLDAGDPVRALDLFASASTAQPRLKAAADGRTAAIAALRKQSGSGTSWVPPAPGSRVALVIGNAGYRNTSPLANPRNDAEGIAAALRELGFTVTVGLDLGRAQMEDQLDAFNRAAARADVALIYYAGHALQHQGINYLLPVEARLESEGDLRRLIRMQDVVADLKATRGFRILILDACRDSEMIRRFAEARAQAEGRVGRSVSATRGLAREQTNGVFIAYATGADEVASDGSDARHSPFTTALLRHLRTPDQDVRALFTRVRADVVRMTNGGQRPEVLDNVDGFFQFR